MARLTICGAVESSTADGFLMIFFTIGPIIDGY